MRNCTMVLALFALVVLVASGVAPSAARAATLLFDDFDDGNIATATGTGVNGGFGLVENEAAGTPSVSEAGTDATVSTSGYNDGGGIVSTNSFDVKSFPAVTATWVVTSADVPDHNGIGLTLTNNQAFWKVDDGDPYLRFRFDDQNTFNIFAEVEDGAATSLYSDTYTVGDVTDGFTFTATITATGWSFTSTDLGLTDASGNWTGTHDLDSLFDNSTHIGGFIQQSNSAVDISFDSMEVVGVAEPSIIPEPASIAAWSLLGLMGVGYGVRRKRRP